MTKKKELFDKCDFCEMPNKIKSLENSVRDLARGREKIYENYISQQKKLEKAKSLLTNFLELKNIPCARGNSINMMMFERFCAFAEDFLKEE